MENPALEIAQAYIDTTNTIVFLTGKAGTGKTTFLRQLRQASAKKMVIAAPTGVAAINAGGMTIHSLFQLPFGPILPNAVDNPEIFYSSEKRALFQSLELLVIDEISMVRPDVLDHIDLILRNVRGSRHAFGGVQLLLIGDLAQLSPIIRDEEWAMLRSYYATPYFFSSLVLQNAPYVRIELDKVYRQNDETFVTILNEMRSQKLSAAGLEKLNARFIPNFKPDAADPYITLTTHNRTAQAINKEWLDALNTTEMEYTASVRGEFPSDGYPTDVSLKLKVGAQVMFVKNDTSAERRYYNGKIGQVARLEADTVHVVTPDGQHIAVQALEWTNIKYQADGDQISEDNAGSFAQIPLKTAWAITIHKSQGLTFDKAVIDIGGAFAHGQAYVALSRCRSLDGLVLRSRIGSEHVIADPSVTRFNQEAESRKPDAQTLQHHREAYRVYLLSELFNFSGLIYRLKKFEQLAPTLQADVVDVAAKMDRQLGTYADERIRKACAYFHEKLSAASTLLHSQLTGFIGTSKELAGKADELLGWIMSRLPLLETFANNEFTIDGFLEMRRQSKPGYNTFTKAANAKPNEKLYEQFLAWREKTAAAEGILESMLFSNQTLAAIAEKLPATLKALSGVKGVGAEKTNRYGASLLTMVRAYQQELTGTADQVSMF